MSDEMERCVWPLGKCTKQDRIEARLGLARDADIAELVEGLRALVKQNEDWNAAVMQVTGRPAGWTNKYLSPARDLIAKYGDKDE